MSGELEILPSEPLPDRPAEAAITPKRRQPGAKREVTAKDLATSPYAAVQMLLRDNARLDAEVEELRRWRDMYHEVNTELRELKAKAKKSKALETLSSVCFVLAGLILGYARAAWTNAWFDGAMALVVGSVLLVGGIVAKAAAK
jgi:hypothetical protein